MRAHLRSEDLPAKDIDNYCHVFPDFLKNVTLLIGWDYFEQDAISLVITEAKRRNDMWRGKSILIRLVHYYTLQELQ